MRSAPTFRPGPWAARSARTIGSNLGLVGQLLLLPLGAFAIAAVGAVIEPTLLRPLYRRPEEYVLLLTFGLLMILEDAMKLLFGGTPLSAPARSWTSWAAFRSAACSIRPTICRHRRRRAGRGRPVVVHLPHAASA